MRPLVLSLLAALSGSACLPETDLTYDMTSGAGNGAAVVELVEPAAGATDVPRNLAAVVVRFPEPVGLSPDAALVRLRREDGGQVPFAGVAPVGCTAAGSCYRVALGGTLEPGASYVVEVPDGARTESGAPLAGGVAGGFATAAGFDEAPPGIGEVEWSAAGPCGRLRFATDEPVQAQLTLRAGGEERVVDAGSGAMAFDIAVRLDWLPPDVDAEVAVRAIDRAGNAAELPPIGFRTPPVLAPLVITEVLANAAGTEPAQEFVEILNVGGEAVSTEGLRLEDSKSGDALPADTIGPGEYALVVPSTFDSHSTQDVPPVPGTRLLRVDTRLGGDGLTNGGEAVRLRDAGGAVVTSYGGWVDMSASSWNGKSTHRLADDACDHPSAWTRRPASATPGGPRP